MNDGINSLAHFIKENIEENSNPSYLVCLNDNDISLKNKKISKNEIGRFGIESNLGMLNLIREICKNVIEKIEIAEVYCWITIETFMDYNNSMDSGPIQILFETDDGKSFSISFTSSVLKNIEWLNEYSRYRQSGKETEHSDDFIELNEYLRSLDDGEYKSESRQK